MRLLITGASGFIGTNLTAEAFKRGFSIRLATRNRIDFISSMESVFIDKVDERTDWSSSLSNIDAVIHLANRAHIKVESYPNECFHVNTLGTLNLARQAASMGVKRFVFVSTIGVNGTKTKGHPFTADDTPAPSTTYARSKNEAELGLKQIMEETDLEVVIIRPPLVYGPDAVGNFSKMIQLIKLGLPLPLGSIRNKRSLVGVGNLVDFILLCVLHPNAKNQTFLIADNEVVSTPELFALISNFIGTPIHLFPFPTFLLRWTTRLIGKPELGEKLCDSLEIDIKKNREILGWTPPLALFELF